MKWYTDPGVEYGKAVPGAVPQAIFYMSALKWSALVCFDLYFIVAASKVNRPPWGQKIQDQGGNQSSREDPSPSTRTLLPTLTLS